MNQSSKFKAVIFDIDGTLTNSTSWDDLTLGLGANLEKHRQVYSARLNGNISLEEAKIHLLNLWTQTGKADKKSIERIFYTRTKIRPETYKIISYLKSKKYQLCLITGSINIFASMIAKKLNIKDYYSNATFYFDKNGLLMDYDYEINQQEKKLEQLNYFRKTYKIKLEECICIGDSLNDIGIFNATGNGIAIKTEFEDKELEKSSWKIINNLTELRDIL